MGMYVHRGSSGMCAMVFVFGPFELDLATRELRRNGRTIPLQPRVFGLLRYLVEHRDRAVGKQELIEALWAGQQLNAVAVPWTINRARKALGTDPAGHDYIETVRGHGYRFVREVRAISNGASQPADAPANSSAGAATEVAPRVDSPFVGRESVMQRLAAAMDAAVGDHGSLFLLTGEPGIGKTRCAQELASLARQRSVQVWSGRCFEAGIAPAFWPFIQVLRAACGDPTLSAALRKDAEGLLLELQPSNQPSASAREPTPVTGDVRFWLLDRLSSWLSRSARSQVRLLILEDLHGADESSLQALALLSPMLAQSRMLVLATSRDPVGAEREAPAAALPLRLRPCEHVPLTGLRLEDIQAYLATTVGENLSGHVARALSARTAGNPLFLREVARTLRIQLQLDGTIRVEDVRLPQAIRDIIRARFQALDQRARELLEVACVIGEAVSSAVLTRVVGSTAPEVLSSLQVAVSANVLEPNPDGSSYTFVHPLMREVLYAELSSARRAALHATVATTLETLGVVDPPLNELAYHFHRAPIEPYYERALHYGRRAGDAAMRVLAYDEAVQFYAWALEAQPLVEGTSIAETCELILLRASALILAGRFRESRQQCERAIELARAEKLPAVLARAARILRPSVWFAQLPDPLALEALEAALELLPESELEVRALAYAQLSSLPPYALQLELSRNLSGEAVRRARQVSDVALLLDAQRSRLFALSGPDSIDDLLRVTDEMAALDKSGASSWGADAQLARYHALFQRGEMAGAERALLALTRISRELRVPVRLWHCDRLRAQRMLDAGRLDEAEQRFEELWQESQRMRLPIGYVHFRGQHFALNRARTGKTLSARFPDTSSGSAWAQHLPVARAMRIAVALENGEPELAREELRSIAAHDFAAVSEDPRGLFVLARLSDSAIALDERDAACSLRELMQPYASLIAFGAFTLSIGCVARYLGRLEHYLGRDAQARSHLEHAIEVNARTGHELERLRASVDFATCLADSEARSDRARARALAAEVNELAGACGALAIQNDALALEARMGTRAATSERAPAKPERSVRASKTARSRVGR
jgi:DNA-binding winged helix-turn-helix (wHTH) protein/tetratricopeptide (TPR) repeat protein